MKTSEPFATKNDDGKVARFFVHLGRRSLVYGVLCIGSLVFLWPFLWMVGTSFKSGQEVFTFPKSVLPQTPVPQVRSPYIDTLELAAPTAEATRELLPRIDRRLKAMAYPWPGFVDRGETLQTAAAGVCQRLAETMPADRWKLPAAELESELSARITPVLVDEVLARMERELLLGPLRVRTRGVEEEELVRAENTATAWKISGDGCAHFEAVANEGKAAGRLHYDFSHGDLIRLTQTFHTKISADQFAQVQLSLQADQSWHSLRIYVEKGGVLYKGARAVALADHENWSTLTWQEPGPDDQSNRIHTWIILREAARGPQYVSDPHQIKITLKIRRAGQFGAWWAKLRRNYALALDYIPFWRYVATSLFLVVVSMVGTLFSCSLVAYSFARLKWPGRDLCFVLMLATLMIPSQITMIPQFLIVRQLGWYNTLLPLWVPHFFGSAFYIFLLRQFFKGIPRDLEEAAIMDGCGFLRIYFQIMLPLVKPTLAAIAILSFMGTWNDFMGPLIYVSDQRLYPLSFGLYAFTVQANAEAGLGMGMTMAGSLLMTLPVVVIFFFAQKYFIQSALLSGMK